MTEETQDWGHSKIINERIDDLVMDSFDNTREELEKLPLDDGLTYIDGIKGRFVVPTGGGKTRMIAHAIAQSAEYGGKMDGASNVHVVFVPRLLLLRQLVDEISGAIRNSKITTEIEYLAFCSILDEMKISDDAGNLTQEIRPTTNGAAMSVAIKDLMAKGKDVVIFVTYRSAKEFYRGVKDICPVFDTMICDESHFATADSFFKRHYDEFLPFWQECQARLKLFFTATERYSHSEFSRGLNNEEVFGKILTQINPLDLIKANVILRPRIHIFNAREAKNLNEAEMTFEVTTKASAYQITELFGIGKPGRMPYGKVIIACSGRRQVNAVRKAWVQYRQRMENLTGLEFDIYTSLSKEGRHINGVAVKADAFLKNIRTSERNCLIFHIDTLSEGIDCSVIAGTIIMRKGMIVSKLLQTLGRVLRPFKIGEGLVDLFAKPFGVMTIPVINGDESELRDIRDIVIKVFAGGFRGLKKLLTFQENNYTPGDKPTVTEEVTAVDLDIDESFLKGNKPLLENIVNELDTIAESDITNALNDYSLKSDEGEDVVDDEIDINDLSHAERVILAGDFVQEVMDKNAAEDAAEGTVSNVS